MLAHTSLAQLTLAVTYLSSSVPFIFSTSVSEGEGATNELLLEIVLYMQYTGNKYTDSGLNRGVTLTSSSIE